MFLCDLSFKIPETGVDFDEWPDYFQIPVKENFWFSLSNVPFPSGFPRLN